MSAGAGARALAALSLEQKVRLLTGADFWALHAEPAVGLRRVVTSDGPAGVRGERWDERDPSANVPSPTALAATWDEERVERIGGLLAAEARRKGVDVLLAPTVNLQRTPYAGRHFECLGEDPLLTARIGAAYVRGVQGGGVAATVKHLVCNDSETERFTVDVRVSERALRELYLAPFEAIVRDARPWAVMAAYNGVGGHTMTESPLLDDVLRGEWGFDGVVVSDWFATRSTDAAARAGLDLAMPGPGGPWGDALVAAVRDGRVDEAHIDAKVERLLRLAGRVGALTGSDLATKQGQTLHSRNAGLQGLTPAGELRAAAAAGMVLARNAGGLLPLARDGVRRVAVVGPNAARARTLGGGSATVFPPYTVSPLDGVRAALGEGVEVVHAPGVHPEARLPVAPPELLRAPNGDGAGVEVRFLDAGGAVLGTERRLGAGLVWLGAFAEGVPAGEVAAIEVRTRVRAATSGEHLIGCAGVGRLRLEVDGAVAVDERLALAPGADPAEAQMFAPQRAARVLLEAGDEAEVVLRHEPPGADAEFEVTGASLQLLAVPPRRSDDEELEHAVALARDADVAIVVVGTTAEVESEGFDRATLALPGRQDELVERVAAANARTVVVVNAGAPVLLPWFDRVPAVLLAWFPGQEAGNALADVLLGAAEPGGRLPVSWPAEEEGLPSTRPAGGVLEYTEGLLVGHRSPDLRPLLPFGHGLGWTTWEYGALCVEGDPADGAVAARVCVTNTGARAGREVVQVYAERDRSAVERPVRWLAGFAAVTLAPGEEGIAEVAVARRAFEHWDAGAHAFVVEPGRFTLAAGRSAGDLRRRATVDAGVSAAEPA